MPAIPLGTLLRVVAVASGSAAFALTVLAWQSFRRSPFGDLLGLLAVLLALFTAVSALSLGYPGGSTMLEFVEALTYSWLVVFVVMMVRLHDRLARAPRREPRD